MGTASRACSSCDTPVDDDAAFCPNCGAATPTDLNLEFGEGFEGRLRTALADRYRIDRELGRGGMAVVFLAHDLKHDRSVALKVMRPELAASIGTERFLREIQIAAKLSHPHILAVFDSGEAKGFLYYVMPHVEGRRSALCLPPSCCWGGRMVLAERCDENIHLRPTDRPSIVRKQCMSVA